MIDGWRRQTVGEIIRIASGQVDPKDDNIGKKVSVGPENLRTGGGIERHTLRTARDLSQISGKYAFDGEAILYSKIRPNLNKVGLPDFDGICSADVYPMWIKAAEIANRRFVYFFLTSERFVADASSRSFRTGLPKINRPDLESIFLDLPPLPEQRKIAEILQTWDEAIEKSEALRAAKLRQYSAIRRRFLEPCHPSFQLRPDSWREFEFGDVFRERTQPGEEGDPLLSITMSEGVINRDEVGRKDTSTENKSRYKLIMPGDIGYNTMRMWQGVSGLSMLRGIVSPAYTIVTPNHQHIAARYAAHLFKSRRIVFDFQRYSQGLTSDTWNLKFPAFSKIRVFLPPLKEQEKQAELFDMLRQEITAIERQSKTLNRQKRGLMQKLLTGEWRAAI